MPEHVLDLYHAKETDSDFSLAIIPMGCERGGGRVPVVSLRSTTANG